MLNNFQIKIQLNASVFFELNKGYLTYSNGEKKSTISFKRFRCARECGTYGVYIVHVREVQSSFPKVLQIRVSYHAMPWPG